MLATPRWAEGGRGNSNDGNGSVASGLRADGVMTLVINIRHQRCGQAWGGAINPTLRHGFLAIRRYGDCDPCVLMGNISSCSAWVRQNLGMNNAGLWKPSYFAALQPVSMQTTDPFH